VLNQSNTDNHLSLQERRIIENRNLRGWKKANIARDLDRHRSTICREVNDQNNWDYIRLRNGKVKKTYSAVKAQQNYDTAKLNCGAKLKCTKMPEVLPEIEKRFWNSGKSPKTRYSLDAIIGQLKLQGVETFCYRTMYNYIRRRDITEIVPHDLPRMVGRKRTKEKKDRVNKRILGTSIEQRPEIINKRQEFGHWEGDCIVDKDGNAYLIETERLSRKIIIRRLESHTNLLHTPKFSI